MDRCAKLKWSNFHVTVNPNKHGMALMRPMRECIESLPDPEFLWRWLKHYKGGRQQDFTDDAKMLVETVRLRAAFECQGKQNKALHVHIVIEVGHRTMVQLYCPAFEDIFFEFLRCAVNAKCRFVKGVGEDKDFILQYLSKEVPSYRPRSEENRELGSAFARADEVVEADL